MGKIASLLGIGISVLIFGFLAASCGGDDWRNVGSSGLVTIGLWRTCPLGGCYEIAKASDWEKAVRAFMIMSCIAGGLSILTAILSYLGKVPNTFTAIALAITAICAMIGIGVYTNKTWASVHGDFATMAYGWSYILGWLGFIGALGAAVFVFLCGKND